METKTLPVCEIFGPTIQGEGEFIGTPVVFVRFAGCDNNCRWCDTKYARTYNKDTIYLRAYNIRSKILEKFADGDSSLSGPLTVVLTGGNPALHDCGELVQYLHISDIAVHAETQGTLSAAWLRLADYVAVSPKPPSSGSMLPTDALISFVRNNCKRKYGIKIVVATEEDFIYAHSVREVLDREVGADSRHGVVVTVIPCHPDTAYTYAELAERVAKYGHSGFRLGIQLQRVIWGNKRGV